MRNNQFGRRNLLPYIRTKLALELEETIAARSRQGKRTDIQKDDNLFQISEKSEPLNATKELAAIAGVSHDTVAKVKKIEAKADDLLAEIAEEAQKRMKAGVAPAPNPGQKIVQGLKAARAAEEMDSVCVKKLTETNKDQNATRSHTKAAELFNHCPPMLRSLLGR